MKRTDFDGVRNGGYRRPLCAETIVIQNATIMTDDPRATLKGRSW